MPYRDDYWTHNPIKVQGGLKLEEDSVSQWWAERWLESLDEFSVGHRQERGKRYAVQGQVLTLSIEKGAVLASVQGTNNEPYHIDMGVTTLSDEQWLKVFDQLSNEVGDVAKLLAGIMPHGLEYVFRNAGVTLFPRTQRDLWTTCSCPDASNPCKHIAAVHYLLAQEFARDPFLILKLRGLEQEELLHRLGLGSLAGEDIEVQDAEEHIDVTSFWTGHRETLPELPALEGSLTAHMALIKQLGPFPMWRGQKRLFRELKGVYSAAQSSAVNLLASEKGVLPPRPQAHGV
ncbi:MAG: SWIM zinc finger family protein [Bacillota bacterium]|nr:SWIM zinc finger family protein [Bacillota bacterium]